MIQSSVIIDQIFFSGCVFIKLHISIILVPSFPSPVVDPILHASSCFVSIIRQTDAPLWKGRSLSDVHCVTTESVLHRDPNISAHNLHLFVSGVVQILVEFHSPQLFFCQNPNKILSSKDRLSFFIYRRSERVRVHFDM